MIHTLTCLARRNEKQGLMIDPWLNPVLFGRFIAGVDTNRSPWPP